MRNSFFRFDSFKQTLLSVYNTDHATFLAWAYRVVLGRQIDDDGATNYHNLLNSEVDRLEVLNAIATSNEALLLENPTNTSDSDYIRILYRRYLHRDPDQEGYGLYTELLRTGTLRATIEKAISTSTEATCNVYAKPRSDVLALLAEYRSRTRRKLLFLSHGNGIDFSTLARVYAFDVSLEMQLKNLREELSSLPTKLRQTLFQPAPPTSYSCQENPLPPQTQGDSLDVLSCNETPRPTSTSDVLPFTLNLIALANDCNPAVQNALIRPFFELLAHLRTKPYRGVYVMGSLSMGWNEVFKQRTHHVAEHLARRGYLVLCAMNSFYDADYTPYIRREDEKIFVVNFEDRSLWRQFVDVIALEATSPRFYHLVGTEPGTTQDDCSYLKSLNYTIVYDYIDEISKEINLGLPDLCMRRHDSLLKDPDVIIICSADNLYEKATKWRSQNVLLATNGVSLEDWIPEPEAPTPPEIEFLVATKKPIIGYYGNFASWMDFAMIRTLAQSRPDYHILMIGHDYDQGRGAFAKSGITSLANVHILPAQKYQRLKLYSRFFDVGIIPFREYELTESVSPVKMFEYMAQGLPIVATGLKECLKYASCLVANSEIEFVNLVDRALGLKQDENYLNTLRNEAAANTWEERAGLIDIAMQNAAAKPPQLTITIAVPSYNLAHLLPRCLDSLLAPVLLARVEVLIINDGSTDDTLNVAQQYSRRHPGTVRVIDKKNGGHGSCINLAIRHARGRYFKIVDSDDWLNPLDLLQHICFLDAQDNDLVLTNYLRVSDGIPPTLISYEDRLARISYTRDDFFKALQVDASPLSYAHMHAMTYKTQILKEADINITENAFYVDQEYITLPLVYVRSVAYQSIVLYRYYIGRPGQSISPAVARKRSPDNFKVFKKIIRLLDNTKSNTAINEYITNILYHQSYFFLAHSIDKEKREEMLNWWQCTSSRHYTELANVLTPAGELSQ